ncbi:MAG: HypC/HybG/HupF family hydrogenase formation chaperone [Candidatus Krumholzibacteria bacterium]|nr:HypC/HybG/HupF family hydrogenase formation chaperone [Candidatus Krumholzibacteria bacterium]
MCLAIPMRITQMEGDDAVVEAGGIKKKVRLDLLDGVVEGDYILIHTGYAIEKLDKAEALETLELIKQVYRAGMTHDPESGSGS